MVKKIIFLCSMMCVTNSVALTEKQHIKHKKIAFHVAKIFVGIGTLLPAGMVLDGFKDFYKELFTNAKIINGLFFMSGALALGAGIWCISDGVMGIYMTVKEEELEDH